jgi:hypothetical protein
MRNDLDFVCYCRNPNYMVPTSGKSQLTLLKPRRSHLVILMRTKLTTLSVLFHPC